MNESLYNFKLFLLNTGLFKKVSKNNNWYRVKECPYCGDTKWHLYVNVDLNSDTPVGYNCFKSNCKGLLDKTFLDYYNLEWNGNIPKGKKIRKINGTGNDIDFSNLFDYDKNTEYIDICREYIQKRVGVLPTDEELKMFCVIGNPIEYAGYMLNDRTLSIDKMCWFLCSNGMLAGRNVEKKKDGWEKFTGNRIFEDRAFYTIKKTFDMYDTINICICEGIMDAIGLYYHGYIENAWYIAVLGKDYMSGVKYALDKGIYGDSVSIRIYKDADVKNVKIDNKLCQFYRSVGVYMNTLEKDFGVSGDMIEIEKIM